jgi:hypothetical protein
MGTVDKFNLFIFMYIYILYRLFLAICDDDIVSQILFSKREYCEKSICAIRFGAMSRMSDLKDIGVRIDLVDSEYFI